MDIPMINDLSNLFGLIAIFIIVFITMIVFIIYKLIQMRKHINHNQAISFDFDNILKAVKEQNLELQKEIERITELNDFYRQKIESLSLMKIDSFDISIEKEKWDKDKIKKAVIIFVVFAIILTLLLLLILNPF